MLPAMAVELSLVLIRKPVVIVTVPGRFLRIRAFLLSGPPVPIAAAGGKLYPTRVLLAPEQVRIGSIKKFL